MALAAVKPTSDAPSNRTLSVPEAATYVGVSVSYLNQMRTKGGGVPFIKMGTRVVYAIDDLNAYLAEHRRTSTADKGDAK